MTEQQAYQAELDRLLAKRRKINAQQMESYRNGSASRARTTTRNAETSKLNERIIWLREQLQAR
jgi:23S rRNA A2030 N6-methylase RlmJ